MMNGMNTFLHVKLAIMRAQYFVQIYTSLIRHAYFSLFLFPGLSVDVYSEVSIYHKEAKPNTCVQVWFFFKVQPFSVRST